MMISPHHVSCTIHVHTMSAAGNMPNFSYVSLRASMPFKIHTQMRANGGRTLPIALMKLVAYTNFNERLRLFISSSDSSYAGLQGVYVDGGGWRQEGQGHGEITRKCEQSMKVEQNMKYLGRVL